MNSAILLLRVVLVTLIQVQSSEKCTERYTLIHGPTPRDGRDGIQGVAGRTGDKGDQGNIGPPGHKGDKGNIGAGGPKGDQGNIGPPGHKGDKGNIGAGGSKGDNGNIGATGLKGDRGNIGETGSKGDKGNIGAGGPKGDKGNIGATGPKGDKGSTGATGTKGDRGSTGATGTKGDRGSTGATGTKGDRGSTGATGTKGDRGSTGATGTKGDRGNIGATGPKGDRGSTGPAGPKGNPGSVTDLLDTIQTLNQTLADRILYLESLPVTVCNITSANWRRVAYFDTTRGDTCPTGLRTVTNTTTKQTACGRTANGGCTSLQFSPNGSYTNVCGRVRGYQYYEPEAFDTGTDSIDSHYLHGVSITHGTPRTHLWSYVAGESEQYSYTGNRCPCARPDPTDRSGVPSFVGENFYCESGFSGSNAENRIVWEDPLWDGQGCFVSGNQCCNRYGWFHRKIPATSDNIEVRWCADSSYTWNEDVLTDQLEIWVM